MSTARIAMLLSGAVLLFLSAYNLGRHDCAARTTAESQYQMYDGE